MTNTISDEARELTLELYHRYTGNKWLESDGDIDTAPAVQTLTAARNKALEDAAECVEDFDHPCCEGGNLYADEIRAMKVQP